MVPLPRLYTPPKKGDSESARDGGPLPRISWVGEEDLASECH